MKTSGLRLADSGGGAAAHTRAHNRGILADVGAKWRSPNKTHKSFKMFGSGFAPQSKRHWVGNLRLIRNRPVATPDAFSTGCAGLSTVQPVLQLCAVGFCRLRLLPTPESAASERVRIVAAKGQSAADNNKYS